jgi:tRNA G18 (ribose-2'-O)-methylase SpoU
MRVLHIVATDDERVADYRNLTDVGLRKKLEPEHGIFLAESHQVIARALRAGYAPRSVLTTSRWLDALSALDLPAQLPILVADEQIVNAITGYRVHRGALAAMARRPLPELSDVVSGPRLAIFEHVVDHTNLGAGIRSAAAFGVSAVLVTPECADPLYRRAVRVSMGAVFDVPWTRLRSWPEDIDLLKSYGYTVVSMTPGKESINLDNFDASAFPRLALILGTEGAGVTPKARTMSDYRIQIPMHSGVDSLNMAAAAAVAFYAMQT